VCSTIRGPRQNSGGSPASKPVMNALTLLCMAIVGAIQTSSPKNGHLVGHVDIGPLTPVERPGVKPVVPPAMYRQYTVSITQPGPHNGPMRSHLLRMVTTLKLSDKGDFQVDLPPGLYRVDLKTAKPTVPQLPQSQEVTVRAGKSTKVEFRVDTGIR
jgi:hypothetical protein